MRRGLLPAALAVALAAAVLLAAFGAGILPGDDDDAGRDTDAVAAPGNPGRSGRTAGRMPRPDGPYAEIQETIEAALLAVLAQPAFGTPPGITAPQAVREPFASSADWALAGRDWPAPALGPMAAIRCRLVAVPPVRRYEAVQAELARVLGRLGMGILWRETLGDGDFLRLDIGAPRRPTHTLVLHRPGDADRVFFSETAAVSVWDRLAGPAAPTIALVVDDWGNGAGEATARILDLPIPLTLSILPDLPYSRHFAAQATAIVRPPLSDPAAAGRPGSAIAEAGGADAAGGARLAAGCPVPVAVGPAVPHPDPRRREVILHLPMQPDGFPDDDPGPNAVLVGMDRAAIAGLIDRARAELPMVTGVNNHMGSAATRDPQTMAVLMDVLRERDLLFLDSMTSAESVAYPAARAAGLVALRNRLFLDAESEDPQRIAANLDALVEAACATGFAVGIGHPHPRTAEVLAREIPRLRDQGVRFVTLSELAELRRQAAQDPDGGMTP